MKTLPVPAELEQLQNVQDFISGELEAFDCPMKAQFQIEVAVEEIFVNIVSYAYRPEVGDDVRYDYENGKNILTIRKRLGE